jgi:hypothetical protein
VQLRGAEHVGEEPVVEEEEDGNPDLRGADDHCGRVDVLEITVVGIAIEDDAGVNPFEADIE